MSQFKNTTIEEQWRVYRDACYPPSKGAISDQQEIECRQAFFAGVLLALKIAVESSIALSEEAAFKNVKNMIDEAQTVCRSRIYEMRQRN